MIISLVLIEKLCKDPRAAQQKDSSGNLPIHVVVERRKLSSNCMDAILKLIHINPVSMQVKDKDGKYEVNGSPYKQIALTEYNAEMEDRVYDKKIPKAVASADQVFIFSKDKKQISTLESESNNIEACSTTQEFLRKLSSLELENTHLICLSNGSFDGIHQAILERI